MQKLLVISDKQAVAAKAAAAKRKMTLSQWLRWLIGRETKVADDVIHGRQLAPETKAKAKR